MARGINKVILVGNLGNDPETKYTQGGMAITSVSLATTTVRKGRDGGEATEKTEWHRVKFFGKLGEIAGEYLRKGSQVYVEGRISYDEFTGQDGVKKFFTDIIADEMQMLGGRGEGGGGGGARAERSGGGDRPARQAPRSARTPAHRAANRPPRLRATSATTSRTTTSRSDFRGAPGRRASPATRIAARTRGFPSPIRGGDHEWHWRLM